MQKIIDLALEMPPTQEQVAGRAKIQSHNFADTVELTLLRQIATVNPATAVLDTHREKSETPVESIEGFVARLDESGIVTGVVDAGSPELTAGIMSRFPGRFIGAATVNPHHGMQAVKDLEQAVKYSGIKCWNTCAPRFGLRVNDKKFYPLYARAAELGIPVVLFDTDTPEDGFGGAWYVNEVATDFPELRLIAAPDRMVWIPEIVGLARRHEKLFFALKPLPGLSTERNADFKRLVQILEDRAVFASEPLERSSSIKQLVETVERLEIAPPVLDRWLFSNARRLFSD